MDVLLLTSIDPYAYQIIPDLGLMYLASSLREQGFTARIRDCRKEGIGEDDLAAFLRETRPGVVGIKCYSNEVKRVGRMAKLARELLPESLIVVGGPHPSMDPKGTLTRMPEVDYAFVGEAELSLSRLLAWRREGQPGPLPEAVRGIAFRSETGTQVRPPVFEEDLDRLPLPAWDLCPPKTYPDEAAGIFVPAFPAAPLMLSRGCPFRCGYCGGRYITGGRLRYRSARNVLREIELLEREYGVRTFTFVDDNFTWDRKRAMELFQALAERPRRIAFTFPNGVRADSLDEELLKMMERAGCYLFALGIESGSDATLARMKKNQTVAQVREAVALARRATKILVTGFFLLGYPGETIADVKNTIRFAVELPLHHAHFCMFIPLAGTPAHEEIKAQGFWTDVNYDPEDMTIDRHAFSLPGLPAAQLIRLHRWAYIRFYLQPWRLISLVRQFQSLSHFRVALRRFIKLFR